MAVSEQVMRHLSNAQGTEHATEATLLPDPEPRPRHYTIISVDDHLIEPAHCFEGRLPSALQDRAPKVITLDDGRETWIYEDNFYPQVGLNAVAGRPKAEWSMEPARFDEMRPGAYDPVARLVDMEEAGIDGSISFPTWTRFCGRSGKPSRLRISSARRCCSDLSRKPWFVSSAPRNRFSSMVSVGMSENS